MISHDDFDNDGHPVLELPDNGRIARLQQDRHGRGLHGLRAHPGAQSDLAEARHGPSPSGVSSFAHGVTLAFWEPLQSCRSHLTCLDGSHGSNTIV